MLRLPPAGLSSLCQVLVVQSLRQQRLRSIAFLNIRTTHIGGSAAHFFKTEDIGGNEGTRESCIHVLHETWS